MQLGSLTLRSFGDWHPRYLTGFFETRDAAARARDDLIDAGFCTDDVVISGSLADSMSEDFEDKGFWASLKDFFISEDEFRARDQEAGRNPCALTLSVADAEYHQALTILDRNGAVDMDEQDIRRRLREDSSAPPFMGPTIGLPDAMLPPVPVKAVAFGGEKETDPSFDNPVPIPRAIADLGPRRRKVQDMPLQDNIDELDRSDVIREDLMRVEENQESGDRRPAQSHNADSTVRH